MSLYSWKKEFYPVEATVVPIKDALAHSLKKWEGLLPDNLAKHGLMRDDNGYVICELDETSIRLDISSATCALCQHYLREDDESDFGDNECVTCPLAIARGGIRCDEAAKFSSVDPDDPRLKPGDFEILSTEEFSPYREFTSYGDAKPMIFWLKRASEL